ncbi:hypothetical protein FACS1894177_03220 [Bacteroidia bacterium]|nr:hypothetical protein FACS1894177_03220 [Bacteroidia bacterium]
MNKQIFNDSGGGNRHNARTRRGVARNAPTRTFLAYIILFITLALAPLAAHADMPPNEAGQRSHGVDFAALTNPANKVYYGQYKHRTSPSARDSETRPVLWRTMGEEASDGKLSLFSEYVLDNHTFHGTSVNGSNYYPNSDIHKWLDVAFRDEIFSATEYSSAAGPEIVTGIHHAITGNPITGSYSVDGYTYPSALPWRIAVSRIYLPWSIFGLTNAGVYWTAGNNAPSGRLGTSAESIGTYRNGTTVAYWTRTAAYNNATQVLNVSTNGSIVSPGTTATSLLGVRPAFKINPTEVLFASEIKTSANTANGETNADGTNYAAPAAGTKNFKLTILNSALTYGTLTNVGGLILTTGSTETIPAVPGGTVAVTASGATAGTFLTCKIVNSSGAIVGYKQGSNTSLTVNATNLSGANLAFGNYTVYVWAQKNNDKISHEGSVPKYFTLIVAPLDAEIPTIGTQPTDASYAQNAAATPLKITATVNDGGTLSYQWYSNTTNSTIGAYPLSGTAAKTASYTPPTTTVGTRYYYCIVTNTNNNAINKTATATSTIVAITVNTRVDAATPVIGTQPVGANYTQGATATPLTVAATASDGGTLSYQWYSNTTNSTSGGASLGADNGARTAGYTPPTTTGGTIWYYCVVTNTNNNAVNKTATATSNTAEVTVTAGLRVNGGDLLTALADVKNAIVSALSSNATATVTGGLSGVTETLTLTIPAGKTVVWQANLEGSAATLVNISGGGTLDVAAGGLLKTSGKSETIAVGANTTVKVSSGTVDATNNSIAEAIYLNGTGARAEVTGGEVKAVSTGIECRDGGIVSVSGGTVSSSAVNGSAIDVYGASTVEISGNATVTSAAGFAINVNHRSTAVVSIKGGTVTGRNPIEGGSIIVSGGALSGTNTGAIMLSNNANAFILGGTITAGGSVPISRSTSVTTHTGAAYYIGERAALFNDTFTPGTNLFKFDGAPALTANGAAYTYNGTTPSAYPVVAALWVQWLDLRGATVTASAGNPTVNTTERTVTFDKTVNDPAITLTVTGAKIGGTNIPFDFTTAAFGVNTTGVGLSVNGGNLLTALADIKNAIESALSSNATATVTGALSGVTADLTLTIPAGKTVAWQADYSGSNRVYINGSGTFEIASGGNITSSHNSYALTSGNASVIVKTGGGVENTGSGGTAIYVQENASLTVDGGTVSAQSRAINANGNATATVKSGTVESAGSDAITISSNATLAIEGGTVRNTGLTTSVVIIYDNSTVFVSGGTIAAGGIQRNASAVSATGYFIGARQGLFNATSASKFTFGTDLFQLDALTLQPPYNSETPSENPVVATLSNKLDLTNATVIASAGNPDINLSARTVTFNTTLNNAAITLTVTGAKIAGTNIPVSFTTTAFGVNVTTEGLRVNGGNLLTTVADIKNAIELALDTDDVTVTGTLSGVTEHLTISIPAGKTVVWKAAYSGKVTSNALIRVLGTGGTLQIDTGAAIENNNNHAVRLSSENSRLIVNGGTITSTNGDAIELYAEYTSAVINGGTITGTPIGALASNSHQYAIELYGNNTSVVVNGGTLISDQYGIFTNAYDVSVTVNNGTITGGDSGIRLYHATLEIKNGTVSGAENAVYLSNGVTATISGGNMISNGSVTNSTICLYGSATLAITGGSFSNTVTADNLITLLGKTPVLYVAGGSFDGQTSCIFGFDGVFCYTGDRAALFDDYLTPGTTLFKLDGAPALTADGNAYAYDNSTPSAKRVIAALSAKLDLTDATVTASAGNPTVDKIQKTVTFNETLNDPAITITVTGAKIAGTNIPVSFTTAAFGVNVDTTAPILSERTVSRTSDTEATIGFTTSEAGVAYYLVVNANSGTPTKQSVKDANNSLGAVSGTVSGLAVTLDAGAKDIYVVVQDAVGNISAPMRIAVAAYAPTYGVSIATLSNGTVELDDAPEADHADYKEGDIVALTVRPDAGYELDAITVTGSGGNTVETQCIASLQTYTFVMPTYNVTVNATFKKTADQLSAEAAKTAIEGMNNVTVAQATANTEEAVKTWLAGQINDLAGMSATGITVTASDITLSGFTAATAGNAGNHSGTNGSFTFTVSLQKGNSTTVTTASKNGTITATIFIPTPTADDLNFTIPANLVYNGTAQGIGAVTGKSAGMGTVTVKYNGSTTVPTDSWTYDVTADITEGTNYRAATNVHLGVYIIGKATVNGVPKEVPVPVNFAQNVDVTLAELLPALTSPMSFGTIAYTLGTVENTQGVLGTISYTSGNSLTLPVQSVSEADKTATVNITVSSSNFNDFTATVTVKTVATTALSITGLTVQTKTYDGTAAATLQGTAALSGVPAGDDVSLSGTPSAAFDNKNAGANKPVTVSGLSLTGEASIWYHLDLSGFTGEISPKSLANDMIAAINNSTYNGTAQTPALTVTDGNLGTLALNTDYENATYSSNTNAGTASASITGKGNYTGTASVNFSIAPATLTATNATLDAKTYDGTIAATVSGVTFTGLQNNETLTLGTDFTAEANYYTTEAGTNRTATVTVTLSNTAKAKNYDFSVNGNIIGLSNQTIGKATTSGVNQTQGVHKNHAQNVDFDLATLWTEPESPKTLGTVTYSPVITANADGVLGTLSYTSGNILALPVQSVSTAGKTATVTVTVSSTNYADFTATITIKTEDTQDDADIATVKSLVEGDYTTTQVSAPTQAAAKSVVEGIINALGSSLNGVTPTVNDGTFTAATAGTPSSLNGTNGSYTFTVTLSKGYGTPQTTGTLTLTITATPYDATQDNADITFAKNLIESETYTDTQANIPDATAAKTSLQGIINDLGSVHGVTATVVPGVFTPAIAGTPSNMNGTNGSYTFTVNLNKGGGTQQTTGTLTLTVTATPYDPTQDNDDIAAAKNLVENATYTDTQANIPDAAAAIAKVNAVISGLALNGVSATVAGGTFTPATTGNASNPAGTNGSYIFTVNLNKGGGTQQTTVQLTLTVTATPYTPPATHQVNIATTTNGTVSANPASPVSENAVVTLTISPATGYELDAITVTGSDGNTVETQCIASLQTYTFVMPTYNVTVNATFKKTADQLSAEAAKTAIEGMNNVTVAQATANTEADVKSWLATQINALAGMSATGITVSASDITLGNFTAAVAGNAGNPSGANGSFTFTVSLQKGNSATVTTAGKNGTITATAYIAPTYAVTIGATSNGTVLASAESAAAGTTVTVTVTPATGYELDAITAHKTGEVSVTVSLNVLNDLNVLNVLKGNFEMPAFGVTITATFKKTQAQLDKEAVEAAKAAIEGGTYRIAQATGNDAASVKTWLASTLNILFGQSHDIQFRSITSIVGEVTVTAITPAIAGTEALPDGTNGSFAFTVSLERGATKLTATVPTGVIVATPYSVTPLKRIELSLIDDLTARIINTGNVETGELTLALSGTNADVFSVETRLIASLPVGSETNIAITPHTDLAAGTYTATLTVSGEGITPVSVEIVYTVKPTGIDSPQATALKAYVQNGTLHVSGLTVGKMWSIYGISGALIYQSVAHEDKADFNLSIRGVYIVTSGNKTVKVMY